MDRMQTTFLMSLCWVVLLVAPALAQDGSDHFLVRDGQAVGRIFIPPQVGHATVLAAEELQRGIEQMTGAKLTIAYTGQPGRRYLRAGGTAIVLKPATLGPYTKADRHGDDFSITRDDHTIIVAGRSEVAVLFGVYTWLAELGARWYMPGDSGTAMPTLRDIPIGSGTKQYTPSFASREMDLSGTPRWHFPEHDAQAHHQEYDLWLLRNRVHFARPSTHNEQLHVYDFNWRRDQTGHNIRKATLKRQHVKMKDAPERFPLVTRHGKQQRSARGQICFTHPANIAAAAEAADEFFKANPDQLTFSLSLEDTGGVCECERCTAANGGVNPAWDCNRLVWGFMNTVAEKLQAVAPGKRIGFYATYGPMTQPPADMKASPHLLAITCHVQSQAREMDDSADPFNQQYMKHIAAVRAAGDFDMGAYDYSMYQGTPQPLTELRNPIIYHKLGYVRYHLESMGRDDQRWLVQWVLAQLMWNVDQDPMALLSQACDALYGQAGPDVMAIFQLIDRRARAQPKITLGTEATAHRMMSEETIAQGKALLAQAKEKVTGDELARLERMEKTFDSWVYKARIIRAAYIYQQTREPEYLQQMKDVMAALGHDWEKRGLGEVVSTNMYTRLVKTWGRGMEDLPAMPGPREAYELKGADRQALLAAAANDIAPLPAEAHLLPEIWRLMIDPLDQGQRMGWLDPGFDDSRWFNLSTWDNYDNQGFFRYNGAFWLRLKFHAPVFKEGKRIMLRIGALDDGGKIYLNRQLVLDRRHFHPNDWRRSFDIDVTDHLRQGGENLLVIQGENTYGAGGVWRPCALYEIADAR